MEFYFIRFIFTTFRRVSYLKRISVAHSLPRWAKFLVLVQNSLLVHSEFKLYEGRCRVDKKKSRTSHSL